MDHARELARDALGAGETAVAMGGDGLTGAVADELRGTDARARHPARRPRQRLRAQARHPVRSRGRLRRAGRRARARGRRGGGRTGARTSGSPRRASTPTCRSSPTRTRLPLGGAVYAYSTLAALRGWRAPSWHVEVDGEVHDFTGYSVAVANSGIFGGGMQLVPHASLDDGAARRAAHARAPRTALPAQPAEGVQGPPRRRAQPHVPARRGRSRSTPTGRSPPTPTATRSPTCR